MKRVCIALDYTPLAEKVARTGHAYARALGAEITLVHVVTDVAYYMVDYDPIMGFEGGEIPDIPGLEVAIYQYAENFLTAVATHLKDSTVKTAVLVGSSADAILVYMTDNSMDLIVLGTHGNSGLEQLLMGNTAARVVRFTKVPVLLVPTNF